MTKDEKFKAIIERLKDKGSGFDPMYISAMVIIGYLSDIAKEGIIEAECNVTPLGKSVLAICEEFDWKPSNKEIYTFVTDIVEKSEQIAFMVLIKKYRDDREGLFKEFEDLKKPNGGIDKSE